MSAGNIRVTCAVKITYRHYNLTGVTHLMLSSGGNKTFKLRVAPCYGVVWGWVGVNISEMLTPNGFY